MKSVKLIALSTVTVIVLASLAMADSSGRIYGKLTTVDGETFEGLIRWDKNEGSWVDILNGNRELPRSSRRKYRNKYGERTKKIKLFGIPIRYSKSYSYSSGSAQSGIRFGHIKMLEVIDDDAVLLTLKSGETVEFENYSTDIGESIRELVIEDRDKGEIEFDWDDLDRIEFMQADAGLRSNFGERLYGTLSTRSGDKFTGWVCWDVDELFTEYIIDGKQKRRKRKIEFGKIKSIERKNSSSAIVTLKNGDELRLRGTNDVDDSNRGIIISDEGFGQVVVEWDEFDRLDFTSPKHAITYDDFDGGHRLEGTVYTEDGEKYTGKIRWDDDEEYTWEILDGNYDDNEFDIEFTYIREIKRKGYRSSIVTFWDGRSFRLRDSNDVDDDNKGIYITLDDGDEVEVEWDEFARVEFVRK
jgi:hypothetical protein